MSFYIEKIYKQQAEIDKIGQYLYNRNNRISLINTILLLCIVIVSIKTI